jgi:membrane associated rhomboid family serine protease
MNPEGEPDIPAPEEWRPVPATLGELPAFVLSRRRAAAWALVLDARGIACRLAPRAFGTQLLVPADDFERALRELRQFRAENRNWPPPPPPERPRRENDLAALSVLLLLATFHNLTLLDLPLAGHRHIDWSALGNAHAGRILAGEWWRALTALTLHADWLHLFSNLAIGGIFIVRLCRDLGAGLAWSLILASGAFGNVANAILQHPDHRAVGASTAVFGALGLLAAVNFLRYRSNLFRRWPLPVAGALALLALLGTEGERTDVGAHLFGFAFGLLLGLTTEYLVGRRGLPGRMFNAFLAVASAGAVLGAWWLAVG